MKMEIKNRSNEEEKHVTAAKNDGRFSGKIKMTDNAREEVMGDIKEDADLSVHSPNDDLDEGETARCCGK